MSTFDAGDSKHEIIIVKRGGGDHEEGHHGGMWKIAFADFMTAMMCFFLVMWLVNAANEQTKASIASYFNPMTLVDSQPQSKGLQDSQEDSSAESSNSGEDVSSEDAPNSRDSTGGPGEFAHSLDQADAEKTSDQHLFSDPYAVLAEIAAQTATLQNVSAKGDGGAQTSGPATGAQGGESYRDPFAPDFWSQEVATPQDEELSVFREQQEDDEAQTPRNPVEEQFAELDDMLAEAAGRRIAGKEPAESDDEAVAELDLPETAVGPTPREPVEGETAAADAQPATDQVAAQKPEDAVEPTEQEPGEATRQLAEEIRQEIIDAFGRDSELNKTLTVTAQTEGVMISVTDELNYGMFEVGSAVPQQQLVLAMEKIGQALSEHAGRIRINGHTDGRPFRSVDYDNWRLSTARAHAAYYMLVRGGMDETRIREVAGFADRDLKIADDPFADANRRIEIFLEVEG